MTWDQQYATGHGRYFPAEELVRFLGRTYGPMPEQKAKGWTALEIGCGVGGNVWALTQWGFFVYGLEMSQEAIRLGTEHAKAQRFEHQKDYRQYTAPAILKFPARSANLVVDVQTIQHLSEDDHHAMYEEIFRILAHGGRFFSIHWSGTNEAAAALFPAHPELMGQEYILKSMLIEHGFEVPYLEFLIKTYPGVEMGQWTILEAVKPCAQ